jgi:hypothetical protein
LENRERLADEVSEIRNKFVQTVNASEVNWEKRFAEKFGIVLAATVILAQAGLAPWSQDRALEAVTNIYRSSRSLTVSVPQAADTVLARLKKAVVSKVRFPRLRKGEKLALADRKDAWGIVREVDGVKDVTLVRRRRFQKLVRPSAVADQVLAELDARNVLVKGSGGNLTRQVLVNGLTTKRARYVCIKDLVSRTSKASKSSSSVRS